MYFFSLSHFLPIYFFDHNTIYCYLPAMDKQEVATTHVWEWKASEFWVVSQGGTGSLLPLSDLAKPVVCLVEPANDQVMMPSTE